MEDDERDIAEQRELDRPGEADGELPDAREEAGCRPAADGPVPQGPGERLPLRQRRAATARTAAARVPRERPRRAGRATRERPARALHWLRRSRTSTAARSPLVKHAGIPIPPSDGTREPERRQLAERRLRPLDLAQVPGQVLREGPGPALDQAGKRRGRGADQLPQLPEHRPGRARRRTSTRVARRRSARSRHGRRLRPALAVSGHLADKNVQPVTIRPSQRGTRNPLPVGSPGIASDGPGEGDERDARVRDRAELGGRRRGAVDEQPRGDVPGRREHDAVRDDRPACRLELVAVLGSPQGRDRCAGLGVSRPGPRRSATSASTMRPSPPRIPRKNGRGLGARRSRRRPRRVAGQQPQRAGHAAVADERPCHLGGHDDERELVEATGVDAAEQGVDEPLDKLAAEPASRGSRPLSTRDRPGRGAGCVLFALGWRPRGKPETRGRDRCAQGQQVERRPGEPADRSRSATGRGPRSVGMPRMSPAGSGRSRPRATTEAELVAGATRSSPRPSWRTGPQRWGSARQEIVRTEIDRTSPELSGKDLAPEAVIGLQHDDLDVGPAILMARAVPELGADRAERRRGHGLRRAR